ncbi:MAG: nucleotidyl transferase AbiEii/AbiGii toxin family protein [Myxococcales bacterium]|nr:nucleotidyl transferase AbiEii/AbiGii toxin family protein [Myxococcales bacterium]
MTEKNHAVSVRGRLLDRARREGADFQRLLVRYAIERLLHRLSISEHADDFVLKGATLFALWLGKPHRATRDLDLLGWGDPDVDRFVAVLREVCSVPCPEDGMVFDRDAITGHPIREDAAYAGVRVNVPGQLAGAKVKVQVDIGLGDAIVPAPALVEVVSLLDLPSSRLRAYAGETVVAEKLEALVVLGLTTSRMKDLYDLDLLRKRFALDSDTLVASVRATFSRRGTPIPVDVPVGLTDRFAADESKRTQWAAFLRKATDQEELDLAEVVGGLREWLLPVLECARD